MSGLDGAVVAVLGADGGLGRALCTALRAAGAIVVEASRRIDSGLDLRDPAAGDRLLALVRAQHGRLDGVVNATGVVAFGELTATEDLVIEELFLANVLGPLWLARRVLPALADSGGFLVMISGVVAETPMAHMVSYSASKAALAAAVTALRREVRRSGVRVIDARPPHTETGLATHPLAGTAPKMPVGLSPERVAARIVQAIASGEDDLPAAAF